MAEEPKRQPPVLDGASLAPFTLRDLLLYFLRLGTFGFGGPIALAGYMRRDLVEGRRWVSKQDYLEGLAFSQLSPGPLAAQLAMYLGWLRAGAIGATLVGIAFILPSFLMVLALAALYVHYGSLPWIQGMFYGIGAAVIAIIVRSAIKLVRTTLGKDGLLWVIFGLIALTTAWTKSEIVWLFVLCGIVGVLVKAPPQISTRTSAMVFIGAFDRARIGVCPTILHRRRCSPVLPPLRSEPASEGIRPGCYGGCGGRYRRSSLHPCPAFSGRSANRAHRAYYPSHPDVYEEDP